jgi:uncharacterized protein
MQKHIHEIRDPIHVFIRVESEERRVLNSRPFQRLRHIHQLALTCLLYPGATHRRFEHSLGVMELASRVYDVITNPANIENEAARDVVPALNSMEYTYWRRALRMAALCHDIGHLPFSHAAERELLPEEWDHEQLTVQLIEGNELAPVWKDLKVQPEHVAKLAVGPKKYSAARFTEWEAILAEIIAGDAFGVDRMDYLLRDSHHAGVAYGRFDHYRLVDTLRILPRSVSGEPHDGVGAASAQSGSTPPSPSSVMTTAIDPDRLRPEPTLGITQGGIYSAEAMLLARYFMYTQLYFHPVRRIYDIHLRDFLQKWLPTGKFSTDLEEHLNMTDNEAMVGLLAAARRSEDPCHEPAACIVERGHYRLLYQRNPDDVVINTEAGRRIFEAARGRFGEAAVRFDSYKEKGKALDFPVLTHDGRIVSCLGLSETLNKVPVVAVEYVFIKPALREEASRWLERERLAIIAPKPEGSP